MREEPFVEPNAPTGADTLADAVQKAGGALAREIAREQRKTRTRALLIKIGIVFVLLIALVLIVWPMLSPAFAKKEQAVIGELLPDSLGGLLPDETLGYNQFDLQNAVLGEAREKRSLVVLEQDVQVDSQISQAVANIGVFAKTKTVHSAGTGVYTVDLSHLSRRKVKVDLTKKTMTVTIPHAALSYIVIDPERTVFEETEKAFLAFGDIKLTQEQQNLLENSVKDTMEGFLLEKAQTELADKMAIEQTAALFAPLVDAVAEGFALTVQMEEA